MTRGNGKGGKGYDNKRSKKCETQTDESDYANEQIYTKNLEDLMDYIMQPENETKKNKKKAKKRKG